MDGTIMVNKINDFWRNSPLNTVEELDGLQLFAEPLVGVAAAGDPLFSALQAENAVGPQHLTPEQWLGGAQSVISYFLPFSATVREANRGAGLPAKEWLYGRIEGEVFNKALAKFLAEWLQEQGYDAVIPAADSRFKVVERRSNWSERHVAYVAGLGTLSLNCSLITKKGSAGRLGSVVTNAHLLPTPRDYGAVDAYCNRCGACIRRCPPLAIHETGKDHAVCAGYLDRVMERFKPRYGCGKCQTGVPCEAKIPE
ncbi:MAG TPA: epoxyqueuosine reductase [Patescibacteria group bacterium]|nr:epoxyqueuosine reductase [Patescibacteria group bacterium]